MRSRRAPIFILGNPRSGTTLIRLMLTCHPDVVIPPECGFAVWLYEKYKHWAPETSERSIDGYVRDVMECRKIETWRIAEEDLRAFLLERRPASYPEAAACVYEWYAISRGESFRRWGDKNNFYIDHIPTIHAMYPDAFYVHIVRDGRNVACSYKKLHHLETDSPYAPDLPWKIEAIAREWKRNNETIETTLAAFAPGRAARIRFEDLVRDAEGQLRSLCESLGETFHPAMLRYHQTNRERQLEPPELMDWKAKTLRPPIASEADRYRRELSDEEVRTVEKIAGDSLRRYGFST